MDWLVANKKRAGFIHLVDKPLKNLRKLGTEWCPGQVIGTSAKFGACVSENCVAMARILKWLMSGVSDLSSTDEEHADSDIPIDEHNMDQIEIGFSSEDWSCQKAQRRS